VFRFSKGHYVPRSWTSSRQLLQPPYEMAKVASRSKLQSKIRVKECNAKIRMRMSLTPWGFTRNRHCVPGSRVLSQCSSYRCWLASRQRRTPFPVRSLGNVASHPGPTAMPALSRCLEDMFALSLRHRDSAVEDWEENVPDSNFDCSSSASRRQTSTNHPSRFQLPSVIS